MDGLLVIDKPAGWTSHDVVAKVRRLTGIRRVGHTGTLDPMATGVLVLCLGQATRVAEYLTGHDKRYRATLRFGIETDTYDATGQVTARHPVDVNEAALRAALAMFIGPVDQVPPMYSALKRGGHKLVDLARRGVEVERRPRRVTVHSIDLLHFEAPAASIAVHCSAGTYVRSLAHDVGRALGCGAHLAALERTAAGDFAIEQAVSLERLAAAVEAGSWATLLCPIDAALGSLPAARLAEADAQRARHGAPLPAVTVREGGVEGDLFRVYDPAGRLIGLMRLDRAAGVLRPEKILQGQA